MSILQMPTSFSCFFVAVFLSFQLILIFVFQPYIVTVLMNVFTGVVFTNWRKIFLKKENCEECWHHLLGHQWF